MENEEKKDGYDISFVVRGDKQLLGSQLLQIFHKNMVPCTLLWMIPNQDESDEYYAFRLQYVKSGKSINEILGDRWDSKCSNTSR